MKIDEYDKLDELKLQLIEDFKENNRLKKMNEQLEEINDILWEYISEKDINKISLRIDKIKIK